ncbi:hypothetical protein QJS10_CPB12g01420 [Acorus calamus]|uniref:Uncharacterized protein n=1 Tax=Acorus calamus TaxID=4465 RepID=A0AAV9DMA8_ACOCL|nr:hypothetical protein QJS10_CPB12g01420 [Acorus calamus]
MKQILAKSIQLADQVTKASDDAHHLKLVLRCHSAGLNSISNVSWLLHVSASNDDDDYLSLTPHPIATNEPILCLIWESIAIHNIFG